MTNGNSLINLGDISNPATVLIEKISDAVGAVFLPLQIKRIARAEVESEKIRALGEIKLSEIQERALCRMIHQEGRSDRRTLSGSPRWRYRIFGLMRSRKRGAGLALTLL